MDHQAFEPDWPDDPELGRGGIRVEALPKFAPLDDQMGVYPPKSCPDALHPLLFGDAGDESCFAILDAARMPGLVERLAVSGLAHKCLFTGEALDDLGDHAPWLVKLTPDASLTRNLFTAASKAKPAGWQLWDSAPGFLILSALPLDAVWSHFRKFTRVMRRETWSYFRFWEQEVQASVCDLAVSDPTTALRFVMVTAQGGCCDLVFPKIGKMLRAGAADAAQRQASASVTPSRFAVALEAPLRVARVERDLRDLAAAVLPDPQDIGGRNRLIASLRQISGHGIVRHAQLEQLGRVEKASGFRFLSSPQAQAAAGAGGYRGFVGLMLLAQQEGYDDAAG